jgi:hypothetical protein
MANDPRYMSFDHQYVETVTVTDSTALTNGIESARFITRSGAYPSANGYAAGVNIYRIYGQGELNANGYQVDDGSTLVYEGQLNPSTTPYKPGVFPYQGLVTLVTSGIVIVQVAVSQTIVVDSPIFANASGQAVTGSAGTGKIVVGRALDAQTTTASGAGSVGYIRVKLGNEAGAALA